jgi:hypothetical protein
MEKFAKFFLCVLAVCSASWVESACVQKAVLLICRGSLSVKEVVHMEKGRGMFVKEIDMRGCDVSDFNLEELLAAFPRLRMLNLRGTGMCESMDSVKSDLTVLQDCYPSTSVEETATIAFRTRKFLKVNVHSETTIPSNFTTDQLSTYEHIESNHPLSGLPIGDRIIITTTVATISIVALVIILLWCCRRSRRSCNGYVNANNPIVIKNAIYFRIII